MTSTTNDGPYLPRRPKMLCLVCSFDYAQPEADRFYVEHPDDCTSPTTTRGSWLALPFYGECGHYWRVVIGFYMGKVFLTVHQAEGA